MTNTTTTTVESINAEIIYKGVGIGFQKTQGNKITGRILLITDQETGTPIELVINSIAKVKVIIDIAVEYGFAIANNRVILDQNMYCAIAGAPHCGEVTFKDFKFKSIAFTPAQYEAMMRHIFEVNAPQNEVK